MISWPERCADKAPNTYSTGWLTERSKPRDT